MADKNEMTTTEQKEVAEKKKKEPKKVSAKKLPKLFKKAYTEKQFTKLLKGVYIDEDKALLSSLFKKTEIKGKEKLTVPKETEFTKKELKRLKEMSKAIVRNRKGRFKVVPFVAVVAFIAAVGIFVTLFKNQLVKTAIKTAMENAFEARCDIGSVKVEIFGAQLNVRNLAQANKDAPMKNIFQFDNLDLNFNLTQLLRGRFDAENVEITGVALGTDRTVSGELPAKQKKQKVEEAKDESGFYTALNEKKGVALETAKESLIAAFAAYNPQSVAEDIKENFKSAAIAKETEEQVNAMIATWKDKPAEIETQVKTFQTAAQQLATIDVNKLKTAAEIQDALTKINNAIESGKTVKANLSEVTSSIKTDAEKAKTLSNELTEAIASDRALINEKLGMYTSFDLETAKGILSGTLDSVAYETLGKYYPYLQKAISYAGSMKSSSSGTAEKKSEKKATPTKKTKTGRLYGTDVYWKADRVPKFLIERLAASGLGLELTAKDISNDMDKRGAPMIANGSYTTAKQVHNAGLTVDARSTTTDPLIAGTYSGNNYPFNVDMTKTVSAEGVPAIDGITGITAKLTANEDFGFSIDGLLDMTGVTVSAAALSNENANRMYQTALATIKDLTLGAKIAYDQEDGIDLDITSDLDKKLMTAMKSMATTAVKEASAAAIAKAQEELDKSTGGAASKIVEFTGITNALNSSDSNVGSLSDQLEAKKAELTEALKSAGKAAATDAAKNALQKLF